MKKIVILHGWTYSLDKWDKFIDLLKENGFEVYLPKIPGLTQESSEVWDLDKYTFWLSKLLDKYHDKIILLGQSNGGRIALNYAAKYSYKLEKLILIDSAGILHNEFPLRTKRSLYRVIAKVGKKFTKSDLLRKFLYKIVRENDYEKASANMKKTLTNLITADITPVLGDISTPTLIIWGQKDRITPIKDAYLMKKLIKRSQLHVIKEAKHSPYFTHCDKVVEIIKNDL